MSTYLVWGFALFCCGALAGALAARLLRRREQARASPEAAPDEPKQQARRFFLLNETGNVLIATSLNPSERLPEATLNLFSEGLAHLATIVYAVSGARDPDTGESFSLYDYGVLKRALDGHPFFIRVASEEPETRAQEHRGMQRMLAAAAPTGASPIAREDTTTLLEARVQRSMNALGMDESASNLRKLRVIHSNMMTEAKRIESRMTLRHTRAAGGERLLGAALPSETHVEVGYITLYCECLMGVSLISVKLEHAEYRAYLYSESPITAHDTYLFVSPSQLRKASADVTDLPRVKIPN